jgi:isoleucyl-tRNA synthetase
LPPFKGAAHRINFTVRMKKYPEYKGLNLRQINNDILAWWKENQTFEKSLESRQGQPEWVFYEGPPSANGMPGIHHVMARTLKDIFCRYKTQKGFLVNRKAGWDTHGLPIELGVEKELGITKEDIGTKITVEEYNQACRTAVMRYTDVWNKLTEEMGYWVDMNDPYITYKTKYIESVWWLLRQLHDKNLLYKGYTIQPYSPKAGTGLSSHELNQPGTYRDVKDNTVVAMFKIVKNEISERSFSPVLEVLEHLALRNTFVADIIASANFDLGQNVFLLAWTTTPWTLPSNTALAIGKHINYAVIKTTNRYDNSEIVVVLAKDLVPKYFRADGFDEMKPLSFSSIEHGPEIEDISAYAVDLPDAANKNGRWTYLADIHGKDLVGLRYEQLLPYALPHENAEKAFQVIAGDFVTTEDGTGIVHIAPTFGADDMRVAKTAGVPPMLVLDANENPVPLVDLQGRFTHHLADPMFGLGGEYVKEEYLTDDEKAAELAVQQELLKPIIPELKKYLSVDERIALKLKTEGKAFKIEKYEHSYPHCWRTDKPILYYPLDSWFIRSTAKKDRMIALNKTINWKPASTGTGRFGNWLENLNDWNLSRSRFWGIPLPIWRTEDGTEEKCIGSMRELKAEIEKAVAAGVMSENPLAGFTPDDLSDANYDGIDVHRPYADRIVLVSANGQPMQRESDLIDVWFDSGAMPYAQFHYPFAQPKGAEPMAYPADYIAEGVDQTRGWFFTLHAIATMVFDSVAYKNVISNGLVLDKNGQKMSKRLGNAIDPFSTMETYGADALRWYMITNSQPWDNLKFDLDGVQEVQRKFFGTLYNTYAFFALYANIDGFTYAEPDVPLAERPEIDRWILSELNTLIAQVQDGMDSFEPTRAYRPIADFVGDKLSNWYVRLCRRRFWKGEYGTDKIAAYQTLYTCLETVARLGAPLAPFYMERLYRDLNTVTGKHSAESVHLGDFPTSNPAMIDGELEAKMQLAQNLSSLVLSLRKKEKIKVRQPLEQIIVPVLNKTFGDRLESVAGLVLSETNVKRLSSIEGSNLSVFEKTIKPNFKTLGPKYGKLMKAIGQAISGFSQHDIAMFERIGEITIKAEGEEIALTIDDAEIHTKDVPGMLVASEGGLTVALDITISEELKLEGIARELVNRIQNLRKDSGFNVTDRIHITLQNQPDLAQAVQTFGDYIKAEVLGDEILFAENVEGTELSFDELESRLLIKKE